MSIRFDENDIRPMGRTAMGVKGITLSEGDEVVSMSLCEEGTDVLVVSENGFGKRTDINEYRTQIRAGKGIKTYNIAEKTGKLVISSISSISSSVRDLKSAFSKSSPTRKQSPAI